MVPSMIVPITPTIVPVTPTIVAIVIIAWSVIIGVSVAVVRIIARVIIARSTYEDPKVDTCFRRLRNESR
jgi:hypothetical protein